MMSAPSAKASELVISSVFEFEGLSFDTPVSDLTMKLLIIQGLQIDPLVKNIDISAEGLEVKTDLENRSEKIQSIDKEEITVTVTSAPKNLENNLATPSPTPGIKPVIKPSVTPKVSLEPTPAVKPIPEPIKTPEITMKPQGGLDPEKLFVMTNNYRSSKGLSAYEKDERSCKLAQDRAPEVLAEINGGYMHKGLKDRNLPYFNTENIITMRTEEAAFNWWINDYIHRVQIEGDYKYSCVACFGNACAQEFTSFIPKE